MLISKSEVIVEPNSQWTNIANKIKKNDINVIEANMGEVIDSNKNSTSTAFAHTISRDLNHGRNMSAGVAVVFRKKFGRPQESDFVNSRLTCQSVPDGATVYGLMTKEEFCGKPTQEAYDEAFDQLIEDLKKKKCDMLICSPMGCVHDLVQLEHFSRNLNKLHKMTNATICVISYDQPFAKRKLWHGLNHSEFLKQLEKTIENCKSTDNPASSVDDLRPPAAQTIPVESPLLPAIVDLHANAKTDTSTNSLPQSSTSSPLLVPGCLEYSEVVKGVVKKQSIVKVSQCPASRSHAISLNNCSINQSDYHLSLIATPTKSSQTPEKSPLNFPLSPITPPR